RHTRSKRDWSSDVCSSDLEIITVFCEQFGQAISDFQGVRFQLAKMATDIETGRLLVYNAARLKENGDDFLKEAAMAKYHASEVRSEERRVGKECNEQLGRE